MPCPDPKIRELLIDYVDDTVSPAQAERVKAHLGQCPECRRLEQEYRRTATDLRNFLKSSAVGHLENSVIQACCEKPEDLDGETRVNIETHLDLCERCRDKVSMMLDVERELRGGWWSALKGSVNRLHEIVVSTIVRPRLVPAAVTAAVLVVLGIIYFTDQPLGPPMELAPTADVVWLEELRRTVQTVPTVEVQNDWIYVGVPFLAFFDEEAYELRLLSPSGVEIAEVSIGAGQVSQRGVKIRIRREGLEPGRYQIQLVQTSLDDPSSVSIVSYPFEVGPEWK